LLPYPLAIVADDDPINRAFLIRTLEQSAWRVRSAADGSEAVRLAIADAPHVIVLDINMPGLDGWEAAARIRASATPAAGAPILAFTTQHLDVTMLRSRGFDGSIAKPCTPKTLVASVARWRSDGELAGVERLARTFDAAELNMLLDRLRAQLAHAILANSPALAHRVAGAAGTLGFTAVTQSWLRLSDGDESARDEAVADARRAIAAIDRHLSTARRTGGN
jgi:CheY-like chemotaxis protein